jgi:hypothetical protein
MPAEASAEEKRRAAGVAPISQMETAWMKK